MGARSRYCLTATFDRSWTFCTGKLTFGHSPVTMKRRSSVLSIHGGWLTNLRWGWDITCLRDSKTNKRVFLIRLSRNHDHEQEIALKKVSGTLEASGISAKPDAGEFQTPFSTNPGQWN